MCDRHLNIKTACGRCNGIFHSPYKITDCKSVKIPLIPKHLSEQIFIFPTHRSLIPIVSTHHRTCSGINTLFEMIQKNLSFCPFITFDRHFKSCIFHRIKGKMFDTGDHAILLYSTDQCTSHPTKKIRIFSIYLLRTSPARMIGQIHAYPTKKICTNIQNFLCNGAPDLFFQFRIKGCTSHARYRKTCCFFTSTHNTSCSICKEHCRYVFLFYTTCTIWMFIIVYF